MGSELRAELYYVLSAALKEPDEDFAREVANGSLAGYLCSAFAERSIPAENPDALQLPAQQLSLEYQQLFGCTGNPRLIPVESFYRTWSLDPDCQNLIAKQTGYLMGDAAVHIQRLYQNLQIVIPPQYQSCPDHLCLELELMGLLCEHHDYREQHKFLLDHLLWVKELAKECQKLDLTGFYPVIITAVSCLIAQDKEFLENN
jgi:TorA maturation chaperone TorD